MIVLLNKLTLPSAQQHYCTSNVSLNLKKVVSTSMPAQGYVDDSSINKVEMSTMS